MFRRLVAGSCLAAVGAGGILHLTGRPFAGDLVLAVGTGLVLVPLTWSVLVSLLRRDVGVDAIALVAIAGALADVPIHALLDLGTGTGRMLELFGPRIARGLGLGLSIVERVARVLGAPVEVNSTPGRGSHFAVTVPRSSAAPVALPARDEPHVDASQLAVAIEMFKRGAEIEEVAIRHGFLPNPGRGTLGLGSRASISAHGFAIQF